MVGWGTATCLNSGSLLNSKEAPIGSIPITIPPACCGAQSFRDAGFSFQAGLRGSRAFPLVFSLKDFIFKGERGKRGRNGFAGPVGPSGSPGKEVTFIPQPFVF